MGATFMGLVFIPVGAAICALLALDAVLRRI